MTPSFNPEAGSGAYQNDQVGPDRIAVYHVSSAPGITYFYLPVKVVPVFTERFLLLVILAGVFFGLCSMLMIGTMDDPDPAVVPGAGQDVQAARFMMPAWARLQGF